MRYRLTEQAAQDLINLTIYGIERFGPATAERYHLALTRTFELLADLPAIGRDAPDHPGHRRFWHGRHTIYYREEGEGIVIARLLHVAMDAARHSIEPEE